MNEFITPWTDCWQEDLYACLHRRGYTDVTAYLAEHRGSTYVELAKNLGNFAAAQVRVLQWTEAKEQGIVRLAAMDTLVRILRARLRRGWGKGYHCETNTAGAYAEWMTVVVGRDDPYGVEAKADRVWDCLSESTPPMGWLPESTEDPYLEKAFEDGGWPADGK